MNAHLHSIKWQLCIGLQTILLIIVSLTMYCDILITIQLSIYFIDSIGFGPN